MEFEPHDRMLKAKEVCSYTGISAWQARTLLTRYGVQVGGQYSISAQRLKILIGNGTVQKLTQRHGGRPPKKEVE